MSDDIKVIDVMRITASECSDETEEDQEFLHTLLQQIEILEAKETKFDEPEDFAPYNDTDYNFV